MRIKLDIPLTFSEIKAALKIPFQKNDSEIEITHICTDTEELERGDLFIALKGKRSNGNDYVSDALERSAYHISETDAQNGIKVANSNDALLSLASYYKEKLEKLKITVAITGSVGKTTTKEFLKVILGDYYKAHATKGNLNNLFGVPYTIFSAPKDTEALILEMGMNSEGEISRLSKCGKPDIAIITNVGTSHIGLLGSRENIAKAKLEVLEGMKHPFLIAPKEEPLLADFADCTFSDADTTADIFAKREAGETVAFYKRGVKMLESEFRVRESHLLKCLLPCIAIGDFVGIKKSELKKQVSLISDENIRQKIVFVHNFYIYEDYYNASFESVCAALDYIEALNKYSARSALIGDVMELGEYAEEIHRKIGAYASKCDFNRLFFFGKFSKLAAEEAIICGFDKNKIFINEDIDAPAVSAKQLTDNCESGEIVLLKASRAMKLERIVELLTKNVL